MSEKRCDYCEQDPPDIQRAPCPFCGFKSAAVRGRETDEIEILRHQVAVLQRNLDRAREDHDKERRIVLDRLRAAHEAIEALRPLTVAKSHTVDVYDRARDAVDAYNRAPHVPMNDPRLSASEARCATEAARAMAQVGKRRR